jgi:hypothetical protein
MTRPAAAGPPHRDVSHLPRTPQTSFSRGGQARTPPSDRSRRPRRDESPRTGPRPAPARRRDHAAIAFEASTITSRRAARRDDPRSSGRTRTGPTLWDEHRTRDQSTTRTPRGSCRTRGCGKREVCFRAGGRQRRPRSNRPHATLQLQHPRNAHASSHHAEHSSHGTLRDGPRGSSRRAAPTSRILEA